MQDPREQQVLREPQVLVLLPAALHPHVGQAKLVLPVLPALQVALVLVLQQAALRLLPGPASAEAQVQ